MAYGTLWLAEREVEANPRRNTPDLSSTHGEGRDSAEPRPHHLAVALGSGRDCGGLRVAAPRRACIAYPTLPIISNWISRFSSTAYSSGSSLAIGSMKPLTIMLIASSSLRPRLCR